MQTCMALSHTYKEHICAYIYKTQTHCSQITSITRRNKCVAWQILHFIMHEINQSYWFLIMHKRRMCKIRHFQKQNMAFVKKCSNQIFSLRNIFITCKWWSRVTVWCGNRCGSQRVCRCSKRSAEGEKNCNSA